MVDSVKNNKSVTQSATQLRPQSTQTQNLRDTFKNISSRLDVGVELSEAAKAQTSSPANKNQRVNSILRSLNEAVSFSSLALKSLEDAGQSNQADPADSEAVQQFAEDVQKLRQDVMKVLDALREKADTAEVIDENYSSATSTIEDVNTAHNHAVETGSQISFNSQQAVEAHSNLSVDRVADLLSE